MIDFERGSRISRSALVPHSAERMFALVADVRRYPEFIPWCVGSSLQAERENVVQATLDVKRAGLRTSFTTRNKLTPPQTIAMSLLKGPFEALEGEWAFQQLADAGARITLALEFRLSGPLAVMLRPFLADMADSMVDAFSERAQQLYARGAQ